MKKIITIFLTLCLTFSIFPLIPNNSVKAQTKIKLSTSSVGQKTVILKWNKIKKPEKGYAIFRNGKLIKHLGKKKTTFTDIGLSAGTTYAYQIKTYKTKKVKRWYNKATGKWQKKKPAKKHRGKSKKITLYNYSKTSNIVRIKTKIVPKSTQSNRTENPNNVNEEAMVVPNIKASVNNSVPVSVLISWGPVHYFADVYVYKDDEIIEKLDYESTGTIDTSVDWNETHRYKISYKRGIEEVFSNEVTVTTPQKPEPTSPLSAEDAENGEWLDVTDAYTIFNNWRTNPANQWYYAENGSVYNTGILLALQRDVAFEAAAKQRAKEQWIMFYVQNMIPEGGYLGNEGLAAPNWHYRPDGQPCSTTYAEYNVNWKGENLYYINSTNPEDVIIGFYDSNYYNCYIEGWAETSCKYASQGHRRNMLNNNCTKVGIACFKARNKAVWIMVVGK